MDRLLVVSASETEVMTLAGMLGRLGFEVIPALNGDEALKTLAHRRPDLILLDLHLPGEDGFTVCQRIQEHPEWADIPIIFISEKQDKEVVVRALESGGVDYVAKPFHKQELLSRVRTQLMLKTSREYAKRLAQEKEELVGIISHHLQNHLAGIQMSAQLLEEQMRGRTDGKMLQLADNIRNSTGQVRAFVTAYLANAAADHGIHIKLEPVGLAGAVTRVLQQYEDAAKAKEISIHAALPDKGVTVRADAPALQQVLDNLVSNAIKFSPRGKQISVAITGGPLHAECRVADQGAGFTEEDKTRLFQRYARLSARPTGGEPSTGLGLSIAKKLVDAMGGELSCESVPQKGTEFIVRLPCVGNQAQPPAPENPPAFLPTTAKPLPRSQTLARPE